MAGEEGTGEASEAGEPRTGPSAGPKLGRSAGRSRTIEVDYLARVEGEGSLKIRLEGGVAKEVQLAIFEPPRFFEALLRGRDFAEAPDITARICGICPVAYLMSACRAMEDALAVTLPPDLHGLRRLLYCGEWIESHALHAFMLHAPDFLGFPDAIRMAKDHGDVVRAGLRIKKAGNAIVTVLGGREIHPINVRVGGFYKVPSRDALAALLPDLRAARAEAAEALRWAGGLSFPELTHDHELVALDDPDGYPFFGTEIVSTRGLRVPVRAYDEHFVEQQAPWSSALRSTLKARGIYLCGPLARFALGHARLDPTVQALAREAGLEAPCRNPFKSLLVRLVEVVQALEEAIRRVEEYAPPREPSVPVVARAGTGYGATEAPRGLLYHRYTLDERGTITDAQIVAPTAQNQLAIEADLCALAPQLARTPLKAATLLAERAIRNHDPCISCATHFLTLEVRGA